MRLLAQRGHFEPGAGGHDQDFQRRGVERTIGAGVGVEQGGNFIFQDEGQDHDLFVLGSAKLFDEAVVHLGDVRGGGNAVLVGVGGGPAGHVERKIFDGIVVAQAAALPSSSGSGFHDEERDAGTVQSAGFQQGAQDFFLGGASMNAGDGRSQITWNCIARNRASSADSRGCCGQFREHSLHQLSLQFWNDAIEDLRHCTLDDLLELLAVRHQRTVPMISCYLLLLSCTP